MKLNWAKRSLEDMEQIATFIEKEGGSTKAREHVQKLIASAEQLVGFPLSGRVVPEFRDPQIREIIKKNYRIVYKIHSEKKLIYILTVFESHKLLK